MQYMIYIYENFGHQEINICMTPSTPWPEKQHLITTKWVLFSKKNHDDDDDDDADDDDDDDDDDEDEDYRDQLSNFWWHPVSVCSVRRLLVPYDKGDIWVNCIFCKLNIKSFVCASQRAEATWLLASNEKGQLITVFNELMHLADFDDDN